MDEVWMAQRLAVDVPEVVHEGMLRLARGNLVSVDAMVTTILFRFMSENRGLFAPEMQEKIVEFYEMTEPTGGSHG